MEKSELDLISRLAVENDELRHLYNRHQGFEKELNRLEGIRNPSEDERKEISRIKRQKLAGKDKIRKILSGSL